MKVHSLIPKLRNFRTSEEGGTLAELAIIVPLLALMLAAVTEFVRFFQTYATLTKATRTATRDLSNHPFTDFHKDKARSLAVCGKLNCAGGDEIASGLTTDHICIESTGDPNPVTVKVSIPPTDGGCGLPYTYQPRFNLGALMNNHTYTIAFPISPATTMYYMFDN